MRVSGFTIIRKGVEFGFPFVESIRSGLPLVDEFVVAVGDCDDGTYEQVVAIGSPKLNIFRTTWDPEIKSRGLILSQQTNLALDRCKSDWCVYLQADEVLHEKDLDRIRLAMQVNLHRRHVLGLSFRYKHFMGSYHILNALGYRRQVRIVRGGVGVRSVGDACGFGYRGSKLRPPLDWRVRSTGAWVYHYGWVKPPPVMGKKRRAFCRFYDGDQAEENPATRGEEAAAADRFEYDLAACIPYKGTHPAVMLDRIAAQDWQPRAFQPVPLWRNAAWWKGRLRKAGLLRAA